MLSEQGHRDGWTRQLAVLLFVDMGVIFGGLFFKSFLTPAAYLHLVIAIWMGLTISKTGVSKWVVVAYGVSVLVPAISLIAPRLVYQVMNFFPFGITITFIAVQWAIIVGVLGKGFTKGWWPLPVSVMVTLFAVVFVVMNMSFKTSEFGPLGMFFANIFATPVLLGLPLLLRIPAAEDIKPSFTRLLYATYGLVGFAWIIYGLRSFGLV